jgi:hypothetical protein
MSLVDSILATWLLSFFGMATLPLYCATSFAEHRAAHQMQAVRIAQNLIERLSAGGFNTALETLTPPQYTEVDGLDVTQPPFSMAPLSPADNTVQYQVSVDVRVPAGAAVAPAPHVLTLRVHVSWLEPVVLAGLGAGGNQNRLRTVTEEADVSDIAP